MAILFYVFVFILGLFVGSFLNLVADRLVSGEPILIGRSHCDFCKKVLKVVDLVPVFSFLSTFGRCRYCKKKLSLSYPLSELLTGSMFLLAAVSSRILTITSYRPLLFFIYLLVIFSIYIVIFLADAKYQIIPTKVIVPGVFVVLAFYFIFGFDLSDFISAILLTAFFWFLFVITKGNGMGFGDVRLALLIGLFNRFPYNIFAIFSAFALGSVFSVFLMIFGEKGMKDKIAFGPFMILGSIVAFVFGDVFFSWYLGL